MSATYFQMAQPEKVYVYIYMCVCVCVYIYTREREIYSKIYIYVYIYIYIYRERERERAREREKAKVGKILLLFGHSVMSDSLQPHGLQHASFPVLHYFLEFAQTHVH